MHPKEPESVDLNKVENPQTTSLIQRSAESIAREQEMIKNGPMPMDFKSKVVSSEEPDPIIIKAMEDKARRQAEYAEYVAKRQARNDAKKKIRVARVKNRGHK
jgi:hypothetical protein